MRFGDWALLGLDRCGSVQCCLELLCLAWLIGGVAAGDCLHVCGAPGFFIDMNGTCTRRWCGSTQTFNPDTFNCTECQAGFVANMDNICVQETPDCGPNEQWNSTACVPTMSPCDGLQPGFCSYDTMSCVGIGGAFCVVRPVACRLSARRLVMLTLGYVL